uniref:Receptor ligand binding region domain-containing protein n=1 Tax=Plectus sambesii TaxID=2011161 RepID=A0A914XAW8_9BILA
MHLLSATLLELFIVVWLHDPWTAKTTTVYAQRTLTPWTASVVNDAPLPVNAALFLPRVFIPSREDENELETSEHVTRTGQYHLATIDSVLPVMDVAISDAQKQYLPQWTEHRPWLRLRPTPIGSCEDQKTIAWAVQEAIHWTNGSGLGVTFGPACDYVLATANRFLSYQGVPMFTPAGFAEFYKDKSTNELITRVGPLQDHITLMIERMADQFSWRKVLLLYEKSSFWESELLESGFCKLMMQGMYVRHANKVSTAFDEVTPRLIIFNSQKAGEGRLPAMRQFLVDSAGNDMGGKCHFMHLFRVISDRCSPMYARQSCLFLRVYAPPVTIPTRGAHRDRLCIALSFLTNCRAIRSNSVIWLYWRGGARAHPAFTCM